MGETRMSRLRLRTVWLLLLSIGLTLGLAGCDAAQRGYPTAMFRPSSPQADAINNLAIVLLIIAGIAFVIVEVWLILNGVLFRNRPEERAVQSHGNLKLEIGWTVATAVVIFGVLGATVWTMWSADFSLARDPRAVLPNTGAFPGDVLSMRVVGHQWWWTMEYPQQQVYEANELHVPVGTTIKAQLEADDVIHSFWVPRLNGKTDTIPGQTNYTAFVATQPDVYRGICGEYCGTEHAHMGFRIVAVSPDEFAAWLRRVQGPAAQPTTDQQRAGEQAFAACAGCHTVRGTAAQGKQGPDLTHFGSRQAIAADTLDNTPENLAEWIRDPQKVKPGNKMPTLPLNQTTVDQLVAYLENLK